MSDVRREDKPAGLCAGGYGCQCLRCVAEKAALVSARARQAKASTSGADGTGSDCCRLPTTPAGRLAYEAELRQMLADAKPRTLLARVRDAWAGMVAGWRGEVGE